MIETVSGNSEVLVSVCLLTYNHEKFIRQAVESVVLQKTNFKLELLIGEDGSTDSTLAILREYEQLHGNIIRVIVQDQSKKIFINGKPTGRWNLINLLSQAKGKYIALLEGDDYWIDPYKLQKQVDFLEANPDYSLCFHQVYEKNDEEPELSKFNDSIVEATYSIEDLAKRNFIHTPSVIYRNILSGKFPEWFNLSPVGDYILHMLNARYGLIKYFPEPMAVYRKHAGGIWSALESESRIDKWVKVLDLLLSENFSTQVLINLEGQKNKIIDEYLLQILKDHSFDEFLQKLKKFSERNEYIKAKWLFNHYPEIIARLTKERDYFRYHWLLKMARKIPFLKIKSLAQLQKGE